MRTELKLRYQQTGAYLLEALVGILIFALGVLGIVGLQAASMRTTTDNSLRAEAVFAATQIMGQMWADVQGNLVANYSSTGPGATYTAWATDLKSAQAGAWFQDPTVDFGAVATNNCNPAPTPTSSVVYIQIFWQSPDGAQHNYATCGLVGQNLS
jgi:type IV pilus assembly protein PilV